MGRIEEMGFSTENKIFKGSINKRSQCTVLLEDEKTETFAHTPVRLALFASETEFRKQNAWNCIKSVKAKDKARVT